MASKFIKMNDFPFSFLENYKKDIYNHINNDDKNPKKVLGIIHLGMGCNILFYKYDACHDTKSVYTLCMHNDDWGQYGDSVNLNTLKDFLPDNYHEYKLIGVEEEFIKNITHKKPKRNIKCPICRETSLIDFSSYKKAFFNLPDGTPDPVCCVCQANTVDIYLGECGHTVLCESCAKEIGEEI